MTRRRDRRLLGVVLTVGAVLLGGVWIGWMGPTHPSEPIDRLSLGPDRDPARLAAGGRSTELRERFDAAVVMLRTKQYESAAAALRRVLELSPRMPEAHVNMGFAMLGLKRPSQARDFFQAATVIKADQANAYYGLALAYEADEDIELALGAMRSYLHLARAQDEAHLRRARAAIWEWETQLANLRAEVKR
jgi:tetratricopeptide (TPR) repeat protein